MPRRPNPHGRGVNKKGRSKRGEPFVMLWRHVLQCEAYQSLKALPRAVYTELRRRFNGSNNGQITCSLRMLEAELHCSKDSAAKALRELEEKGFIKCAQPGSFNYKVRHAPTWILTEEEHGGQPATKDFMRWRPAEKENAGPETRTKCPHSGTDGTNCVAVLPQTVLKKGP